MSMLLKLINLTRQTIYVLLKKRWQFVVFKLVTTGSSLCLEIKFNGSKTMALRHDVN